MARQHDAPRGSPHRDPRGAFCRCPPNVEPAKGDAKRENGAGTVTPMTSTSTPFAETRVADRPLLRAATEIAADSALISAALDELVERLTSGKLDAAARADIAVDLLAAAERFRAFAIDHVLA